MNKKTPLFALALFVAAFLMYALPVHAKTVIKLGIVTTPTAAQGIAAKKFQELVAQRSGGDMEVKIFHSGSLGTETEILQQIQMNAVNMGIITLGPFDVFVPQVNVVAFPFLFKDFEQVDKILDGPLGQAILDSLQTAGFKGLAFSENGFRNLTNNVRPVHSVTDVHGLKIRVMESVLHKELWKTLGANPTPMGWPIYTQLQQGAIDGQENPLSVISIYKLYEVQKYLSLTAHVYSAHIDVACLDWFNSLTPQQQELIQTAMKDAATYQRQWSRKNWAQFLAQLKEKGMLVDEHPELASFRNEAETLKNLPLFTEDKTKVLLEKFLKATQ